MNEKVYLNGNLVERDRALIPVLDYGFLYGYGLFETMRAYGGKVFRIEQHLKRLQDSAKILGIKIDLKTLRNAVNDTLNVNKIDSARVRVTLSPGLGEINANLDTCTYTTTMVIAEKYPPFPERIYRNGFKAITSSLIINSQSWFSGLKSTSYLLNVLARKEARAAGADEAICLNEKGLLAEASMSNIFLVDDDRLKTPALNNGILPGITRRTVIELAIKMGIECKEVDITADELYQSQEAFLTNSLIEIMPLSKLDNKQIGKGRIGNITENLLIEYRKLVSKDLGGCN
ncbi:MAG: aminotransferase class IV family protein [Dehalococcoidia bacterium]|nr:MAG: aminotransferase class IV family protein [Dehalococcoidia bacterium]